MRHLAATLGFSAVWVLACTYGGKEPPPPDNRHIWTVINAMTMMDWGTGFAMSKVAAEPDGFEGRSEGSHVSAECHPGDTPRPTETDEGLRWSCPRKFTDIIIGFEFDSPDMAMDFVFDRQLSDDQTCNCILTPWKGWARMRGQLVESDASETVIVFTTDIDLAYIYPPRDRWDVYHRENGEAIFFGRRPPEGGLDTASPDASRDSGYSVPLDPHAPTEATSRCDVDYQGVTATYTLRGRDLFGKVSGTPTASCEQDGTRYDVICDWFNVDVTDEDALLDGCRYVGLVD